MLPHPEDVFEQAVVWKAAGLRVALATVVETWGSSPRPPGSRLCVNERGAFVGSVSGGCIEGAVITEAMEVMQSHAPREPTSLGPGRHHERGSGQKSARQWTQQSRARKEHFGPSLG